MNEDLRKYMVKLHLAGLEKSIRFTEDSNGHVTLDFVEYDFVSKYYEIPRFVYRLKEGCFSSVNVTCVSIPSSVEIIEESCFSNCSSLQTIIIREKHRQFIPLLKSSNNATIEILP